MNRKKIIICLFFLTSLFFLMGSLELLYADNQRVEQSTGLSKAMAHYNLGKEYFLSKKYSKAYREFGLAAQLDQSDRKSVCRLSEMYLKKIEKLEKIRKQIEAKKRLEDMKTENSHQSPVTSHTLTGTGKSPVKKKQENRKQRIAKEKRQRAEEKRQKLAEQKARVEKIKQEKINKIAEQKKIKQEKIKNKAENRRQKIEDRRQKTEEKKQRIKERKQRIIEEKRQRVEEKKKIETKKLKTEDRKLKTEEIIFSNEVEQRIEINLHYCQGREYFQQKKFMEAIIEFELVRSKIDKNHPYFIPCSIYIEQAREALTRE